MFWAITAACRPFFTLRLFAGGRLWGFPAIPCILPGALSWSVYLYLFFSLYILAICTLSASTVVSLFPEQLRSRPSCLAGLCLYICCLREWKKSCYPHPEACPQKAPALGTGQLSSPCPQLSPANGWLCRQQQLLTGGPQGRGLRCLEEIKN